ncbi:zinc finger protein 567-like isoform X2 [Hyla sarda]|nr:zinc finger protein 567-like isoform X2 [Hyla sarda]
MNFSTLHPTPGSLTSVRFREVVVYFSEEEWSALDPWQKELYSNVMRDIHSALLSLGYTILHPDVLCRVRRDHEPYISGRQEDRKDFSVPSTNASVLGSDIIFKINHGEETCGNPPNSFTKCASLLSPDIVFRIKHDEEDCIDRENGEHNSPKSEIPTEMSDDPNKEETSGGDQKEDQKPSPSNEDLTSQISEADHLVFNPKFSIWVKQVEAVSEEAPEVLSTTCTDGNVTEIKTEIDFTPDCNTSLPAQNLPEATSDKNTRAKRHEIPETNLMVHRDEHAGPGEESLLSIVLRGADAESLYIPNYPDYKNTSSYKVPDHSRGVPRMEEKARSYQPPRSSFQTPNNNYLLSSFRAHPVPLQPCAHQTDRPFRCRTCDKGFKTLGMLNVHMKTHSGVRPYQCSECGKSFRENWNLKVHQKIHTGETPYRCSICDKAFIQYATYMKHRRIHTGEKPYSCCYCDKSFTNSSNLVRHHRTHTGEKSYSCKECGKCFSYNTSLIQHKRVHRVEPTVPATHD